MRITSNELAQCISECRGPSAEGLSGIELTVYRYMMAHPDASLDEVAEYTYKWDTYIPSTQDLFSAHANMTLEEERKYNQLVHDAKLSEQWRNEIRSIIERVI